MHSLIQGSELLIAALEQLHIEVVFGLPGSDSLALFESLRQSNLRTILTTDERAAVFMANGYYRAAQKVAAVVTIAGPGFTNTLTGLAEAHHDSAGLLCLSIGAEEHPEKRFRLQVIDQVAMVRPVVKEAYSVTSAEELQPVIHQAYATAVTGEPGPVFIDIRSSVLTETARSIHTLPPVETAGNAAPTDSQVKDVAQLLSQAGRVVLYAGQGTAGAADSILELAELFHCPVLTTCSGRAVIPENHELSYYYDFSWRQGCDPVNRLIENCDLVLALGCKFTHNGTSGFRLKLPADKLVHLDASADVLEANYPARSTVQCDVPAFLLRLLAYKELLSGRPEGWTPEELENWHRRFNTARNEINESGLIPVVDKTSSLKDVFEALREALPDDVCIVTDSGLHQTVVRNFFEVRAPRGMIVPTDFQSMGFGIPAAIGAKLAAPERPVLAIVGDGCFAMSAMELQTAVREKIALNVIILADGQLGSIRLLQIENFGHEHSVQLHRSDYGAFAHSLGAGFTCWSDLSGMITLDEEAKFTVSILEIPLKDTAHLQKVKSYRRMRNTVGNLLGPHVTKRLKKWLGNR